MPMEMGHSRKDTDFALREALFCWGNKLGGDTNLEPSGWIVCN